MLYEVITLKFLPGIVGTMQLLIEYSLASSIEQPNSTSRGRFTLSLKMAGWGIPVLGDYLEEALSQLGYDVRITSYNVCYTKLLR